jgi:nucleoside-diphosphate-sugar epimerase
VRVAITGASGFVGNRVLERFYLAGLHDVVPLVHRFSSLTLPARFAISSTVCDHFEIEPLTRALEGCEAVVHAAFGSPLSKMSKAIYKACDNADVKRLVVLGSASVYNQNPAIGTTEASPLPAQVATRYNANKIRSDRIFRRLRSNGKTEIVFLMPGIVYGPRSQWIATLANQIMRGGAFLIEQGKGVCNSVYVDNLVEAIRLALVKDRVDGEAFFVSDVETVTWQDFYGPMLRAFGKTFADVHYIEPQVFRSSTISRARVWALETAETPFAQKMKPLVPFTLKRIYKGALSWTANEGPPVNGALLQPEPLTVAEDMNLMQQCEYKLPNSKAEKLLEYYPPVSFAEGMKKSVQWLRFAGYPVVC